MPFEFGRIKRPPPSVFAIVNTMKLEARRRGEDSIDLGKGNPFEFSEYLILLDPKLRVSSSQ